MSCTCIYGTCRCTYVQVSISVFVADVPHLTAVKFCAQQVNLYEARNRKSKALSGGMRRRLSVAMACIGSPDILILDEPTTGLDPASRRQVWEVIENVKEGRSVVSTCTCTHVNVHAYDVCMYVHVHVYIVVR
ncbi:MAG: ATP-binding cassette domain-containing protein [Proteobacteria bacterium]|nr:ATP-binding cassette domain-containing protein [Pseudomonadota bacterium]